MKWTERVSLAIALSVTVLATGTVVLADSYTATLVAAVAALMWFPHYVGFHSGYDLSSAELRQKQGAFTGWRIDLKQINRAVQKPRTKRLSMGEVVVIEAGGRTRMLFVSSASDFLRDLAERTPQLHFYGDELRAIPPMNKPAHDALPLSR